MDDPWFYGLPVFGERVRKRRKTPGADPSIPTRAASNQTRRISPASPRSSRTHIPSALGPVIYTKTCLYTLTPDRDFVVDSIAGQPGAAMAIGAGHAFKFASVIGKTLAELAADGKTARGYLRVLAQPADPARGEPAEIVYGVRRPSQAGERE